MNFGRKTKKQLTELLLTHFNLTIQSFEGETNLKKNAEKVLGNISKTKKRHNRSGTLTILQQNMFK